MVEGGLLFHVGRSLRVKLGWDSVLRARCGSAPSWPAEAVPGVSFVQQFLRRAFSVMEDIETERAPGPGLATFPHRHRRARCTLNLSLIFGSLHLLPTPPRTPLSYPQPPSWPFSPPGSYLLRRHLLHRTSPSVARGPFPPAPGSHHLRPHLLHGTSPSVARGLPCRNRPAALPDNCPPALLLAPEELKLGAWSGRLRPRRYASSSTPGCCNPKGRGPAGPSLPGLSVLRALESPCTCRINDC